MINEEDNDRPYIEEEVKQIQSKWSSFHCQVGETRQLINLSIEYFTLVEEVEECLREGSKLLVTIARKSTSAKTPSEAQSLLKQVDNFIKPREAIQEEKIRKISQLAIQLYGNHSYCIGNNLQNRLMYKTCLLHFCRSRVCKAYRSCIGRKSQHARFFLMLMLYE